MEGGMGSFKLLRSDIYNKQERIRHYQSHIRGLNAYERHQKFVNDYVTFYGRNKSSHAVHPIKTDQDTLREGYRFIPSEDDDIESSWEKRLVKRYYDKLFKEYCIADMSHYKKGKIGLRWRTEKEVVLGKGQFVCGNRECNEKDTLGSYEVNFAYVEAGESKQALVKLVACKSCAEKLVYKKRKEEAVKKEKDEKKRKRDAHSDDHSSDERNSIDRRKKGSGSSKTDRDDEEDFDDYLEGMFP